MQILSIYPQNAPFPVLLLLAKIASMLVRSVSLSVCLSVCLSVTTVQVTIFIRSRSKFDSSSEMLYEGRLSIIIIIRIKFWIQEPFEFFANIGVDGHCSHNHAQSSQISHKNIQKLHTSPSTRV